MAPDRNIPTKQKSQLRRNLYFCSVDGIFATPFVLTLVPGNIFLANFLSGVLGIKEVVYGLIVSMPAWANALQLLYVPLLARRFSSRALTLVPGFITVVIWFGFSISLFWIQHWEQHRIARTILLIFAILSLFQSVNGVSWTSWIQDWIPRRVRAPYFGVRNRMLGLITVLFTAFGGYVIGSNSGTVADYQILFFVTGISRLISMGLQIPIRTPRVESTESSTIRSSASSIRSLLRQHDFVRFVTFSALITFGLNLTGPFVPVYMRDQLGLPVSEQAALVVLANLAGALAMPRWGRLLARKGHKPVMVVATILWMGCNYNWALLHQGNTWQLFPMWLWGGLVSAGLILGLFNLLLRLTPPSHKTTAVSLHLAVTSVAGAIAPMIAGLILQKLTQSGISEQTAFRIFFVVQPTMVISALWLLRHVPEPEAAQVPGILGAFRTVRQAALQSGQILLANANLVRPLAYFARRKPSK